MKRSGRYSVVSSSGGLALAALALVALACGPRYQAGELLRGDDACARADTFFARTFPRPLVMRGHATFDVDTYRVRGRFELRSAANGDVVLEFGGATLLGGHREDVVVSLSGDTLRVLDRERGRYYEGDEVGRMVEEGTGAAGNWGLALRRVLVGGCPGIEALAASDGGLSGSAAGGTFEVQAPKGRLEGATWPDPAPGETFRDRLDVRYRWRNGQLEEIEARLPTRGWRVRLEAD